MDKIDFKLEEIRKNKGLSRRELAEQSGVHQQTIVALETKMDNPQDAKLQTLVKLARVLKCKVRDFYPNEKCI